MEDQVTRKVVQIRCKSAEQKAEWERRARAAGKTLSRWIRDKLDFAGESKQVAGTDTELCILCRRRQRIYGPAVRPDPNCEECRKLKSEASSHRKTLHAANDAKIVSAPETAPMLCLLCARHKRVGLPLPEQCAKCGR